MDEKCRCSWPGDMPLYVDYHDNEWGRPTHDDRELAFFSDPVCWCVEGGRVERRTAHRCPHVR